jgi:NAD(P)H dehydrogenase (quinone)
VRRIVGISTCGSPRPSALLLNDNGRRVLTRALRMSCGWRARPRWLGLYRMDVAGDAERRGFLDRVEQQMAKI